MGRMSLPFYVIYAGTRMAIGGERLGTLTVAFVLAQSGVNLLWGWIADRSGFRRVFLLSLLVWIASAVLLLAADGYPVLLVVMVGLGAGVGGFMMASQNLVLEFGSRRNLPLRIAVANSTSDLVGAVGPLLAGVLAIAVDYRAVFGTAIAFQLAALLVMAWWVEEPRDRIG